MNTTDTPEYDEAISIIKEFSHILDCPDYKNVRDRCDAVIARYERMKYLSQQISMSVAASDFHGAKIALEQLRSEYGENHPSYVFFDNFISFMMGE
jgi:hypothetical protein